MFNPLSDWEQGFEYSDSGSEQNFSDFFESIIGQTHTQPSDKNYQTGTGRQQHSEDHHAKILIDIEDVFQGATRTVILHSPEMYAQGHVSSMKDS